MSEQALAAEDGEEITKLADEAVALSDLALTLHLRLARLAERHDPLYVVAEADE